MDIVYKATHSVFCQKSDFHGNSNFEKFSKARPSTNTSKKILGISKMFWFKKLTHGALQKYYKIK
jgi:hypothetical protein